MSRTSDHLIISSFHLASKQTIISSIQLQALIGGGGMASYTLTIHIDGNWIAKLDISRFPIKVPAKIDRLNTQGFKLCFAAGVESDGQVNYNVVAHTTSKL